MGDEGVTMSRYQRVEKAVKSDIQSNRTKNTGITAAYPSSWALPLLGTVSRDDHVSSSTSETLRGCRCSTQLATTRHRTTSPTDTDSKNREEETLFYYF